MNKKFLNVSAFFKNFNIFDLVLWIFSVSAIIIPCFFFDVDILSTISAIIGVTGLIMVAKGLPIGQILLVIFSILYAIKSFQIGYYGEMITYLFMSMPVALVTAVIWYKNPFEKGKPQVKVATLKKSTCVIFCVLAVATTIAFFFILKYFNTPNLIVCTISVLTSFFGAGLLLLRTPFYAIGYACNDIVLIILWTLTCISDITVLPMIICFTVFCMSDLYGFVCWIKMKKYQTNLTKANSILQNCVD